MKEINDFPDLSQNNIIEQIKAKLAAEDSDKYTKWKGENFDINYGFTTSDSGDVKEKVTLLYLAASFGCTKVVETLLDNEAKIDVTDENGFTPLHIAAISGYIDIVNSLIKKGADVNEKDKDGRTPLSWVVINDKKDIDINDKVNEEGLTLSLLHAAIAHGKMNVVVEALLEKAEEKDVNVTDENGFTPLHSAVCHSHTEVINTLLKKGANVNAVGKGVITPLHCTALSDDNKEIVTTLLDNGAGVSTLGNSLVGQAILCIGAENGYTKVVTTLLDNGVDVNAKDKDGLYFFTLGCSQWPHRGNQDSIRKRSKSFVKR